MLLVAIVPYLDLAMLGANDRLLGAVAAAINVIAGLVTILLVPPTALLLRALAVPLSLLMLALAWAWVPELAAMTGLADMLSVHPPRPAADMQLGATARYLGNLALLIAGAAVGYRRGGARKVLSWLIILAVANLVLGLALRAVDPLHVWGMDKNIFSDRFTGTLQNANAAGASFAMLSLIAAWQSAAAFVRLRRTRMADPVAVGWPAVAAILLGAGCIITASRTAVSLLVLLLPLAVLAPRVRSRHLPHYRKVPQQAVWLLIALVGLGVIGLLAIAAPIVARFSNLSADGVLRAEVWQHYSQIASESPWFGFGLGSFTDVSLAHIANAHDAALFAYINAAHNHALQLILAAGWPFLLLHAAAIVWIAAFNWMRRRAGHRDGMVITIWLALLLVLGCSMVDIALTVPAVTAFSAMLLGLVLGRSARLSPVRPVRPDAA